MLIQNRRKRNTNTIKEKYKNEKREIEKQEKKIWDGWDINPNGSGLVWHCLVLCLAWNANGQISSLPISTSKSTIVDLFKRACCIYSKSILMIRINVYSIHQICVYKECKQISQKETYYSIQCCYYFRMFGGEAKIYLQLAGTDLFNSLQPFKLRQIARCNLMWTEYENLLDFSGRKLFW